MSGGTHQSNDVQRTIPETKDEDVRLYRTRHKMKMWEQTVFVDTQPIIRPAPMFKNIDMLYRKSLPRSDNITQALAGSTAFRIVTEDLPNPEIGYWTKGDPIPSVHSANELSGIIMDDSIHHTRHIDRSSDQYGRTVSK